jgi:hypothetical protein
MGKKKKSKQAAPPPPQQRDLAAEMGQISAAAQANAQAQADATVQTAGRLANQALKSTGKIAKKLEDSTYTAAANQNLRDAGTSSAQLGQSSDQIGQVADRVAAYNDPAQARLNQMAMGQLYRPDQISSQNVAADQVTGSRVANVGNMQAAQAGPVQDIRASAAERGLMNEARGNGLLGRLEGQARNDLALGRSLSAEQSRDAIQAARAGAAARGLGVGNSAMAAELLNRDRFASQRENERRAFASGVLGQGAGIRQAANQAYMGRMEGNVGRQQQAGQFNAGLTQQANAASFDAAQQRAMADAGYAQQANLANQSANLNAAQYNSSQNLAAQQANQSANYNANYANQNFLQSVASQNFNQFASQQGMLGDLYGQQAGIAQNQFSNNLGLAQANVGLDPYQRALGSNIPIATQGNSANMIGQAYGQTMNYGSDLFNTNTNMQASIYNSFMNNQAAMRGAGVVGGSTNRAGNAAMGAGVGLAGGAIAGAAMGSVVPGIGTLAGAAIGGAMGAAGGGGVGYFCWIARAAWGEDNPRWIEFRDSMLTHAPEWFVAAYMQHGESIARHIHTPARRALARLVLSTLQRLWTPAKSTLQTA